MLNPYNVVGKALALFKAAGLPVPAYGEDEKRRLLDAWVQRYGGLDGDVFAACSKKLASGQKFPRFFDMDEAVREALRVRKRRAEAEAPATKLLPIDREANRRRVRDLIEHLVGRR